MFFTPLQSKRGGPACSYLLRLLFFFCCCLCGATLTAQAQLRTLSLKDVGESVICRIGNKSYTLYPDTNRIRYDGTSRETQEFFEAVAPYTDLNTYLYAIPVTNTANVEICPSDGGMNYISYNAEWLVGIYNATHSKWTIYGILAHEIGHFALAHDRRSRGSNPKIELAADEYAGEVLAKMNATLAEAQTAYRSDKIGQHNGDDTHPPLNERLSAVEKGWRNIGEPTTINNNRTERNTGVSTKETVDLNIHVNYITQGPVELSNRIYTIGENGNLEIRFKMTTLHTNEKKSVDSRAWKITDESGTHIADKQNYWTKRDDNDRLLLAFRVLKKNSYGWVIVEKYKNNWWYQTNDGEWRQLERNQDTNLTWNDSGQKIEIRLKLPGISNVWSENDVLYSFGFG